MKIDESTVNLGYMMIERYHATLKTNLIIPGTTSFSPYDIGKIMIGEHKNRFCLYPAHVGIQVDTRLQSLLFIPKNEIIAFVEPDEGEEFIPLVQLKMNKEGSDWIGK